MATKITDGIFIGDLESSQDPEFLELNKITYIINTAGNELPNLWEQHGLRYLTFPWADSPRCKLFDDGFALVRQIADFISEANQDGESVLIHSVDGGGRCVACVIAYLMYRFGWGMKKGCEYILQKRPDININEGFLRQLSDLDHRLCRRRQSRKVPPTAEEIARHDKWIEYQGPITKDRRSKDTGSDALEEERVLTNSYLNGLRRSELLGDSGAGAPQPQKDVKGKPWVPVLHWIDAHGHGTTRAHKGDKKGGHGYPRNGVATFVPERPAGACYNSLHETHPASPVSSRGLRRGAPLKGVLKKRKTAVEDVIHSVSNGAFHSNTSSEGVTGTSSPVKPESSPSGVFDQDVALWAIPAKSVEAANQLTHAANTHSNAYWRRHSNPAHAQQRTPTSANISTNVPVSTNSNTVDIAGITTSSSSSANVLDAPPPPEVKEWWPAQVKSTSIVENNPQLPTAPPQSTVVSATPHSLLAIANAPNPEKRVLSLTGQISRPKQRPSSAPSLPRVGDIGTVGNVDRPPVAVQVNGDSPTQQVQQRGRSTVSRSNNNTAGAAEGVPTRIVVVNGVQVRGPVLAMSSAINTTQSTSANPTSSNSQQRRANDKPPTPSSSSSAGLPPSQWRPSSRREERNNNNPPPSTPLPGKRVPQAYRAGTPPPRGRRRSAPANVSERDRDQQQLANAKEAAEALFFRQGYTTTAAVLGLGLGMGVAVEANGGTRRSSHHGNDKNSHSGSGVPPVGGGERRRSLQSSSTKNMSSNAQTLMYYKSLQQMQANGGKSARPSTSIGNSSSVHPALSQSQRVETSYLRWR